jgi:hypothetical protein
MVLRYPPDLRWLQSYLLRWVSLCRWWFCRVREHHEWGSHRCERCLVLRPSIVAWGPMGRVRRRRAPDWALSRIESRGPR